MRILVYDANAISSRMRHAQKFLTTSDNRRSGVVYGFLQNLNWIRRKLALQREQIFMVWDGGRSAFRKAKLPEYKARKPLADEVEFHEYLAQLDALHKNILHFGIRGQLKIKGIEADDLISAMTRTLAAGGHMPIVYTSDRDLHQLADVAMIYDPVAGMLTTEDILAMHGVTEIRQIPLLKAMQGDPSDKIPGVGGVGKKKASKALPHVLNFFGLSEQPDPEPETNGSVKVVQKVKDCQEIVRRNLELITLPKDFDSVRDLLPGQLEEISEALEHKPSFDIDGMTAFLRHWECSTLLENFDRF